MIIYQFIREGPVENNGKVKILIQYPTSYGLIPQKANL
jgi:hypothetical protein